MDPYFLPGGHEMLPPLSLAPLPSPPTSKKRALSPPQQQQDDRVVTTAPPPLPSSEPWMLVCTSSSPPAASPSSQQSPSPPTNAKRKRFAEVARLPKTLDWSVFALKNTAEPNDRTAFLAALSASVQHDGSAKDPDAWMRVVHAVEVDVSACTREPSIACKTHLVPFHVWHKSGFRACWDAKDLFLASGKLLYEYQGVNPLTGNAMIRVMPWDSGAVRGGKPSEFDIKVEEERSLALARVFEERSGLMRELEAAKKKIEALEREMATSLSSSSSSRKDHADMTMAELYASMEESSRSVMLAANEIVRRKNNNGATTTTATADVPPQM